MRRGFLLTGCACTLFLAGWTGTAWAHGFAGPRFFPATLVVFPKLFGRPLFGGGP